MKCISEEEFATRYGLAVDDPNLKADYQAYVKDVWFYNTQMTAARRDGLATGEKRGEERGMKKGVAIGREQGFNEAAAKLRASMMAAGVPQEQIDATFAAVPGYAGV